MNLLSLIIIGLGSAFAVVWLIHYIPLIATLFGKSYSPRLLFCKTLGPLDAIMTIILVAGAWIGLTTAVTGIGMMIYNTLAGVGLSMGVVFVKKILKPRWEKQYKQKLDNRQEVVVIGEKIQVN